MSSMESLKKKNPANNNQHASLYKKKKEKRKRLRKKKRTGREKEKKKGFSGKWFPRLDERSALDKRTHTTECNNSGLFAKGFTPSPCDSIFRFFYLVWFYLYF